jgi:hypothetical protein
MMCWGVNFPCCSTHEQGWLCGGDSVMVMWSWWWWCSWGVAVGGVFLVDCDLWPSKFPLCDAFILGLVTWVCDTWVHAYGDYAAVSCLAQLGCLGIFLPEALVIRSTTWWLSTVACYFWMPLGKCYLGKLLFPLFGCRCQEKKRRKERKKTFSFPFFVFVTCNLPFLLL